MRWVPARSLTIKVSFLHSINEFVMRLHTWNTMPEEIMGVIPNSIRVPRLLASIIRSQYKGSEVSDETIP